MSAGLPLFLRKALTLAFTYCIIKTLNLMKGNCTMFAAMMNKQNKLQKLWSNWNLFGCFVLSVCANHSAVMVE